MTLKKYLSLVAIIATLTLFVVGCAKNQPKTEDAAEKTATVQTMEGTELDKIMEDKKAKENYLVIDVRNKEEYDAGHVKFAINMDVETFEDNLDRIADFKDKNVVTICNSGKKSAKAADILVANGFNSVYNAQGVKDFEYTTMSQIENIFGSELQAIADENDASNTIIDVRDAKDYEAGHLKGAINIPVDGIEAALSEIPMDKGVVTYCYSGNKSTVAAETLVKNGYKDVKNSLDGTKEFEFTLEK
ncbi:MAG: rhodanese-like domain-containing protein [Peptoniphilus sp.]|uniref:rhodanese-like domain-containing protein n=1 Tax=Peptoniphilus sp. TaxID=1971214 RepID=UPI002A750A31|nr:rhodanese-like domain-containing protein [Peptoniphilus sp.]MDY2986174.1 rhodanese-like domain-containing protein [Peptoniphilus sp.]